MSDYWPPRYYGDDDDDEGDPTEIADQAAAEAWADLGDYPPRPRKYEDCEKCGKPLVLKHVCGPILHVSVTLCPHVVGFFRDDIPPEDHIILTAECEVCGTVTATPPHPRPDVPGFIYTPTDGLLLVPGVDCYLGPRYDSEEDKARYPDAYKQQCDESNSDDE